MQRDVDDDALIDLDQVAASLGRLQGVSLLRAAEAALGAGRVAVLSSFGADSAVLLALAAEANPAMPVVFLETGRHFEETLAYRTELAAHLGLRAVREALPSQGAVDREDPVGTLWHFDPDSCCRLRKVEPMDAALVPFAAWATGRKRHQAATRAGLPTVERVGRRLRLNPIANWDEGRIEAEMLRRGLPRHPLVARGYRSIGCEPCTEPVGADADARAGRWAGRLKTECGIHL